jgi:phytoene dehydrogenase-like protein
VRSERYDAIVVGAGPNGLAAAIVLARAGLSVLVREASSTPGGAVRSEALTRPGFLHDVCSAVYPLGIASPFFRRLPLAAHGLEWIQPPTPLAHPFDDGSAARLERSTSETGASLGVDSVAWRRLMDPFVPRWRQLYQDVLAPLRPPRHPILLSRFGLLALLPTALLTRLAFRGSRASALFAGIAGHATLPLTQPPSSAFGLVLGIAGHAVGWPIPRGGAGQIVEALTSYLRSLGGQVETDAPV